MHWILLFAFLAACHAAITTETLTDEILSSNPSLFQEESSQDLSWIDPETLILSNEYDVSGGDFLTLQDLSSSTTGLASPPCLVNEGDQLPSRKTRVRRDRGTAGSSCDATSNKPWHPPEQINQPGKFDEKLWKEIMGIPGRNQPQPEGPPTLFPILKDPKDDDQNCLPGFPKHLCCAELGPLESFDQLPMIYVRMFQCEIGACFFLLALFIALPPSLLIFLLIDLKFRMNIPMIKIQSSTNQTES